MCRLKIRSRAIYPDGVTTPSPIHLTGNDSFFEQETPPCHYPFVVDLHRARQSTQPSDILSLRNNLNIQYRDDTSLEYSDVDMAAHRHRGGRENHFLPAWRTFALRTNVNLMSTAQVEEVYSDYEIHLRGREKHG